jgi:hypothetical protein
MIKTCALAMMLACAACAKHDVAHPVASPPEPDVTATPTPDAGSGDIALSPPPDVGTGDTQPDAAPAPPPAPPPSETGFARFDDAFNGKAPWITDAELEAGVAELVALQLPGGKGTFTTRRVCGLETKAAVEQLGQLFITRASDSNYDPVACLKGPPPSDKVVCVVAATDVEDTTIVLDYRKRAGAWRLVGINRTTHDATGQAQYAKLEAQYDKLLKTTCK